VEKRTPLLKRKYHQFSRRYEFYSHSVISVTN